MLSNQTKRCAIDVTGRKVDNMISFKNYLALVNESKLDDYPTERHFLISLGFTEKNVLTPKT